MKTIPSTPIEMKDHREDRAYLIVKDPKLNEMDFSRARQAALDEHFRRIDASLDPLNFVGFPAAMKVGRQVGRK